MTKTKQPMPPESDQPPGFRVHEDGSVEVLSQSETRAIVARTINATLQQLRQSRLERGRIRAMKSTTIGLSGIAVPPDRLRALRPDAVDALAESMKRHGQLHAITVRKRGGRGYWVIAGAHRVSAAEKLRWTEIECVVLDDCTADDAELVEIDENLIRAELSPAETAMHIGKRKEIYERQHPETKNGGDRRGSVRKNCDLKNERFTTDTAKKTGKSERSIQLDATRAKRVEVLSDIVNTSLDKGSELDALAKLPVEQQRALAERAKAGEKVSARRKPREQAKTRKPLQRITLLSDEPCIDCDTQQEQWHRSVSNMAGEAISLSAYWTQQFGKDWQKFEVTSDVLTLAKQAAEAWNEIVENMINGKKGK